MSKEHEADVKAVLDNWLDYGRLNALLRIGPLEVYVRKGGYSFDGRIFKAAVQIANVHVTPKYQRQGFFAPVLRWAEGLQGRTFKNAYLDMVRVDGIVIESVGSERLAKILIKHRWGRYHSKIMETSIFYKTL
jgi:hypothetical protein